MSGYKLSSAPSIEPVTLTEAKIHLKLATTTAAAEAYTDENDLINSLITAARQYAESYLNRVLIEQSWVMTLDSFPQEIELPNPPLISVTSIAYLDVDGASQTLSTNVYAVDTYAEPGRIYLKYNQVWPSTRVIDNAVTVTFKAGYGTAASSVPAPIKQAIKLILSDLYEQRQDIVTGISSYKNNTAEMLLNQFRLIECR